MREGPGEAPNPAEEALETLICKIVKQDPFSTIPEIRREAARHLAGSRIRFWQVFSVLRRKRLLRRRSRFRYAWGR